MRAHRADYCTIPYLKNGLGIVLILCCMRDTRIEVDAGHSKILPPFPSTQSRKMQFTVQRIEPRKKHDDVETEKFTLRPK